MPLQHLRSSTANKRPIPGGMSDGQLAVNSNLASPGLFFKDSNGDLVKAGPVHVGTTAPNATPAVSGQTGNSKGEQWLDTSSSRYVFKIWDGTAWRTEDGEFVNASGDTMTGALVMNNQQQVRFRETTANGTNFIAIQAPASVVADRTLTLPDVTGTIVSTGDTGTVTSTMILDGTIVNADVNASAAIAGTKISPNFGSQTITTTGVISSALGAVATPSITFTGDLNTGIYSPGADTLAFTEGGVEAMRIDSSGRLLVGTNVSQGNGGSLQVGGSSTSGAAPTAELNAFGFDGRLRLTRANTGSPITIVASGDTIGRITFDGYDGVAYRDAAVIFGEVDGTPGTNDMPGRLVFSTTTDGAASPTERMRIDRFGRILVGTTSYRSVGDSFFPSSVIFNEGSGVGDYQILAGVHNRQGTEGPQIALGKSRGATNGSVTIVQSGDHLGEISFAGADGVDLETRAALIRAEVDGTPGVNDMPGRLVFSTTSDGAASPTERMRIDSSGDILLLKTSTGFGVAGINIGGGARLEAGFDSGQFWVLNRIDIDGTVFDFRRAGTTVGAISVTGTVTTYATSSDYRLKENVTPVSDGITRLQQLKPRRFNFITDPDKTVDGFIAHEAQAVVPECVTGTKDAVDEEGNPVYQGIDQSKLVPLLTAALQEALQKIKDLEDRLTAAGL